MLLNIKEGSVLFWIDNHIEVVNPSVDGMVVMSKDINQKYLGCYCVDTAWDSTDASDQRYGRFVLEKTINEPRLFWEPCDKSEFPKEFLANLLLLDIN